MFQGLSHDTIVDDFVIPLLARVRTGCAIIYDESAIAYEETPPEIAVEFRRRARIGAGGFQSLAVLWPLLDPRNGWIALTFFSHKVLRWLCPFFLIGPGGSQSRAGEQRAFTACRCWSVLCSPPLRSLGSICRSGHRPGVRCG